MNIATVRSATADILYYRPELSDWRKPDGAEVGSTSEEGRATVNITQEPEAGFRWRICAFRHADGRQLVDQILYENFHYKVATPVFHQWKSENKQVIGLNFLNAEEATVFSQTVKRIVDNLAIPQYQQVNNNINNGVYQDPRNYSQQQQSNIRELDQESIGSGHSGLTNYRQQQQKASYSSLQGVQPSALNQQQRRCSQGSSGSSSTPSSSNIYATSIVNGNGTAPPTTNGHQSISNGIPSVKAPVAPPLPPPQQPNASITNSNGSSNVAQVSKTAPPAPPPPPPGGLSFADQIKNPTLRKTSVPNRVSSESSQQKQQQPPPLKPASANLMSELAAKLGKINNGKTCNADNISTSSSSGVSTASSNMGASSSENNTSDSGSTVVQAKKPGGYQSGSNGILSVKTPPAMSSQYITVADFERFKQDVFAELNKSTQVIAELRQEMSKLVQELSKFRA